MTLVKPTSRQLVRYCKIAAFLTLFSPMSAFAIMSCGTRTIEEVWVEGSRNDNHEHANSMLLKLSGNDCNNKPYVWLSREDDAFYSLLSIAISARSSGSQVKVFVNQDVTTSTASQLSILVLL